MNSQNIQNTIILYRIKDTDKASHFYNNWFEWHFVEDEEHLKSIEMYIEKGYPYQLAVYKLDNLLGYESK